MKFFRGKWRLMLIPGMMIAFLAAIPLARSGDAQTPPPTVELKTVSRERLQDRHMDLLVPSKSDVPVIGKDQAWDVVQNQDRMPEQVARDEDVVPIAEVALARVNINNAPDEPTCLCWVFVMDTLPPIQGPDRHLITREGSWYLQFVDATTGEWKGGRASLAYRPDVLEKLRRGEPVPTPEPPTLR